MMGYFQTEDNSGKFLDDVLNLHLRQYTQRSDERRQSITPRNRSITYIIIDIHGEPPEAWADVKLREFDRFEQHDGFCIMSLSNLGYISPGEVKKLIIDGRFGFCRIPENTYTVFIYEIMNILDLDPELPTNMLAAMHDRSGVWWYFNKEMIHKI